MPVSDPAPAPHQMMEVTVLDTGDLPAGTVISFHTGSVKRHAQLEKNRRINLSYSDGAAPIRVDVMSHVGTHRFDMVPDVAVYDVPIANMGEGTDVKLKFRIRDADAPEAKADKAAAQAAVAESRGLHSSPSRKLQTALMMRSYLDNHDVLRQMQELLQDMASHKPEDPIDYMIRRLEEVSQECQGAEIDPYYGTIVGDESEPAAAPSTPSRKGSKKNQESVEPASRPGRRRAGVSAESEDKDDLANWVPPVHEKSEEERRQLSDMIKMSHDGKLHMLFGAVSKETLEKILDAMSKKDIAKDESVIEQGAAGDFFYIVKSGQFDILVKKGEEPSKKVFEAGAGFAFGELALLYNAPRSATITATVASEVWCLDRTAFRNLVVRSREAQFKEFVEFLNNVDIFHVLGANELAALAEVLEEEEFEDDEAIVEQGERDDKMYIIRKGSAVACIQGDQGEVEVMDYGTGDYFGEIALLLGEARKASVYAKGSCTCLYVTRQTFHRMLGSLHSLLEGNISKYKKYQDAIAQVGSSAVSEEAGEEEEEGAKRKERKAVHRKRERKVEDSSDTSKPVTKKALPAGSEGEPASLADKVALDFKNDALVKPAEALKTEGLITMFGGWSLGQTLADAKVVHVHGGASCSSSAGNDMYSWSAPSKLKSATQIAVVCQKGQKSAHDPTPNQDNFFVHHFGGVSVYGVLDGHGPFGHLVSFRLAQALPHLLRKSSSWGEDWEAALREAFLAAEGDLETFGTEQGINLDASGAVGSLLVHEEQTVHVAFIGDARTMLGSWSKRDSRMIFCSSDHKPDLPEEKKRLEEAGMEVREVGEGSHRIFLPKKKVPGLAMSRAFGDVACKGLLREPEYHRFLMQPADEWYALLATDGIWEFVDGEEAYKLSSKKLRLKGPNETMQFLVNGSRKRWQAACGEYSDDITGILVQWNAKGNSQEANHFLSVQQATLKGAEP